MSIDHCDVQFETHACAKEMKQPTKASWTRLKRLERFLAGTQSARVLLMKPGTDYDPHEAFLRVWSDNDWAGDAKGWTSQSSLKIQVDGCPLYSASRKQRARAHSSGEVEYYAAAFGRQRSNADPRSLVQDSCWKVQPQVAYADVKV